MKIFTKKQNVIINDKIASTAKEIKRDMAEVINTKIGENKAELAGQIEEIKKAMDENKAEIKADFKAEMGAMMDILIKEIQKKSE